MDPALEAQLVRGAARLGVALDARTRTAFSRYLALLLRWNARIKLTSVVEPAAVVEKHFLDALAMVPAVRGADSLVDVGSGAGFPGAVVALVEPSIQVVLVESIQKKAAFLEALRRELPLPNATVLADRMERLVAERRRFAAAVSRATFAPAEWIAHGRDLVAPGGCLVAFVVPAPGDTAATYAPDGETHFGSAELSPYTAGRALVILRDRRT